MCCLVGMSQLLGVMLFSAVHSSTGTFHNFSYRLLIHVIKFYIINFCMMPMMQCYFTGWTYSVRDVLSNVSYFLMVASSHMTMCLI